MIGILDYGVGNIIAFANIFESLNIPYKFVSKVNDFKDVDHIILPGVGAFDYAMNCLHLSGLKMELDRLVLTEAKPVLGVCVGLQMMASSSEEGTLDGLGWIDAVVKKIPVISLGDSIPLPLPHMGWNLIVPKNVDPILYGIDEQSRFYFLHSYSVQCIDERDVIATVNYGAPITSVVKHHNIYGIQQHPEKSHAAGIQFLKNFASI